MILDELAASGRYAALHPGIARAFAFLRTATMNIPDGRHEIDGERVYANVMSYTSKAPPGQTHEAHRRYADVQYLLHGEELIRFTPEHRLGAGEGYHLEKDYELFPQPDGPTTFHVRAGQFAIFFPLEGHQPGLAAAAPVPVRKIVVKVTM